MLPERGSHGRLGYRVSLDLGLVAPLNVVGLDSAWLAGDDNDDGKLRLTDEQVGQLLTNQGSLLPGWSITLVHHPLSELADGREAQRLLTEYGVSLLLHGHLHDAEIARWTTPAANLHISAAGSLYEHDHYPNSVQVLDLRLPPRQPIEPLQLWARGWSVRGHWHNDDSLYSGSVAGKVTLMAEAPPALPFIPSQFIGIAGATPVSRPYSAPEIAAGDLQSDLFATLVDLLKAPSPPSAECLREQWQHYLRAHSSRWAEALPALLAPRTPQIEALLTAYECAIAAHGETLPPAKSPASTTSCK